MSVKRISILLMATMLLSAVPAIAQQELPEIVAVVNGQKISRGELVRTLIDWRAPSVLEEMINFRIIGQEARKAGVDVTVEQVHARIAEIEQNLPPGQTFQEMLKRQGLTLGHVFSLVKADLQTEGVLRKTIQVGPDEMADYRRASHILIRVTPGPAEESEDKERVAKEKIDEIAQEIKDGLAFDEAARKYSEDPMSKDKGGDLDYFMRGQMVPEFDKAVFDMEVGQISDPIKTFHGYHIIRLTGIGSEATGEDAEKLRDSVLQTRMMQERRDWFLRVRNAAQVENIIAPEEVAPPRPEPTVRRRPPMPPPAELGPEDMPPPPPSDVHVEIEGVD